MRDQLHAHLKKRVEQCIASVRQTVHTCEKIEKKKQCLSRRNAEIVKANAVAHITNRQAGEGESEYIFYRVHFKYFIKQKAFFYTEEEIEERRAEFYKGVLVDEEELTPVYETGLQSESEEEMSDERISYRYDRLKAVQYAELWWNQHNPAYKSFQDNCTNYISQCLRAGGAPMRGHPQRGKGWWMQNNNWSYSWTVAHSLRLYFSASTAGLRAKEVSRAEELRLGDVICYDFQGDGRFDHTTIVTGKDEAGMPLVNANSADSRMRYWNYEDSTAYTPNIKYKFFTIENGS